MKIKASYVEPEDYFPKELRKKFGLGEFNTDSEMDEPIQAVEDEKER